MTLFTVSFHCQFSLSLFTVTSGTGFKWRLSQPARRRKLEIDKVAQDVDDIPYTDGSVTGHISSVEIDIWRRR